MLKPINAADPLSHSADLTAQNIAKLRELFPEAVTEDATGSKLDFDVLRSLLGGEVTESEEKYGLNWHGKRAARRLALTPSTGTLRPAPEDSVDWDTTQNLMIEGDNLEVLKLLQKSYNGKVKMIYIDPPYNTGGDFVYKDDFKDSIGNYQELTGQKNSEGVLVSSSTESVGRFHTSWLSMIYPRLILARNLLRDDGAIFISIDDNEFGNLVKVCDEVFGEEAFIGVFVWRRRSSSALAERLVSTDHEYVVCYQKHSFVSRGEDKDFKGYSNPDNDPRGPWTTGDLTVGMNKDMRPNQFYLLTDPLTGKVYKANPNRVWAYIRESMDRLISERRVIFPVNTEQRPMLKRFRDELRSSVNPSSTWLSGVGLNTEATRDMQNLFGQNPFDYSKPLSLLSSLIGIGSAPNEIVLDFFAGSGTTAQAIWERNSLSKDNLRFILVQLPEPINQERFKTIAEITKQRLRLAIGKVKQENPLFIGDLGFKVLKLDKTCIRPWDSTLPVDSQRLLGEIDNIFPDRTEQDLLYELLIKRGVELTQPLLKMQMAGKDVFAVSGGSLIACLAPSITGSDTEDLANGIVAWHKRLSPPPADANTTKARAPKFDPPLIVFRDTAFADDVAKSNLTEILKQHGLTDVRSL